MTTTMYAPGPTEQTQRLAAAFAARHFGTEAIQLNPAAMPTDDECERTVVAFAVEGHHPQGWAILGDSVALQVADDGTVTILPDGD